MNLARKRLLRRLNGISCSIYVSSSLYQFQVHGRAQRRTGVYDQMEQLFTNRKFHFCSHRNFRVFFVNGKRPMSYQTSSKRSPPFWLLIGARKTWHGMAVHSNNHTWRTYCWRGNGRWQKTTVVLRLIVCVVRVVMNLCASGSSLGFSSTFNLKWVKTWRENSWQFCNV